LQVAFAKVWERLGKSWIVLESEENGEKSGKIKCLAKDGKIGTIDRNPILLKSENLETKM
jgi:hypothetical protein